MRLLIILLAFNFISSFSAFAQLGTYELGWVIFHDSTQFSKSFMIEMERQLRGRMDLELLKPNVVEDYYFYMNVDQPDSLIVFRNGFAFMEVDIYDLRSFSKKSTICWRTDSLSELSTIHTSEVSWKNVQFYFTSNLPREEYRRILVPQVERKKGEDGFAFDVSMYLYTYPDISFEFYFKSPPDKFDLEQINLELGEIKKENESFYFVPIKQYGDGFYSLLGFNNLSTNYSDFDQNEISRYVDAFLTVFKRLGESDAGKLIESVRLM